MRVGDRLRSVRDGQIGHLIEVEGGRFMVLLDRPQEQRKVPYHAHDWASDGPPRLTELQVASVVYDADRRLRIIRNEHTVREWIGLKDDQRQAWLGGVPDPADELRRKLSAAVRSVFK